MSTRRPPYTRPKNPQPIRLTKRDKEIFETIHAFDGMMSRRQIDRLYFSGKGRTQVRQRLQALFDHGYVRMPDEKEIHQIPMGEVIYWLDKKGVDLVAGLQGQPRSHCRWRRKPRWSMLEHDLAVNDFRIAVHEACQRSKSLNLAHWVTDSTFRADPDTVLYKNRKGQIKKRQVIPDAFFTIERQRSGAGAMERFSFLLEMDMATESNPRFAREKVRAGVAYLRSRAYRRRFGVAYGRYLVVTRSMKRLRHLKRATDQAGGAGLFYFTTIKDVSSKTLFSSEIWQHADSDELMRIIPVDRIRSTSKINHTK